jgi:hypothetical protein
VNRLCLRQCLLKRRRRRIQREPYNVIKKKYIYITCWEQPSYRARRTMELLVLVACVIDCEEAPFWKYFNVYLRHCVMSDQISFFFCCWTLNVLGVHLICDYWFIFNYFNFNVKLCLITVFDYAMATLNGLAVTSCAIIIILLLLIIIISQVLLMDWDKNCAPVSI